MVATPTTTGTKTTTRPQTTILCLALLLGCAGSAGEQGPPPGGGTPDTGGSAGSGRGGTGGVVGPGGGGGAFGTGGTGGTGGSADAGADASKAPADAGTVAPADAGRDSGDNPDTRPGATDAAPDVTADSLSGPDGAPPGADYNPCPPKGTPCVALPLGDSLTQGAGSSGGGYRRELFRQVVAHGQSVTFVGSAASGPAMLDGVPVPFPRRHEGHGGFTIQNLSAWVTENNTIATYKPHIVMLQIGVNNGLRRAGANVPAVLAALGAFMDQILAADPRLLLIVAQITPNKTDLGIMQIAAYNAGIPAVVAARAKAGKHVAIVDIHKFFVANPNWKTAYLPDNDVHPNDAGYDAMGRGWYSALGPLLR
jgi:lysophospholipase L1-like esterase